MTELIDSDFNQLNPKKENQSVRILSGVLFIVMLPLSAFCYTNIVQFIEDYAAFRDIQLLGAESLHGMVSMFFISAIPVIAYNCLIKRRNSKKNEIVSYLVLLILAAGLFTLFFLLQMELMLEFVRPAQHNPLLPSYNMVIPPFSFCFDLFFIVAALSSFLSLRGLIYISNKRNLLSRK